MSSHRFEIKSQWDGQPLQPDEWARAELTLGQEVVLRVDSADYADPPPPASPGRTDGLWEFEVVELFLLGANEDYLEIELGPHGHWLGLRLAGRRSIAEARVPIQFESSRHSGAWSGEARIARQWLPDDLRAANLYAIHGSGASRRFLAMHAVPGAEPDFHRLEYFGRIGED